MISHALDGDVNSFGHKAPPSPNGIRGSSGLTSPQQTSPQQTTFGEEPPSPPKACEFGDLLAAFNVRNPISGLGQDGLRVLA